MVMPAPLTDNKAIKIAMPPNSATAIGVKTVLIVVGFVVDWSIALSVILPVAGAITLVIRFIYILTGAPCFIADCCELCCCETRRSEIGPETAVPAAVAIPNATTKTINNSVNN